MSSAQPSSTAPPSSSPSPLTNTSTLLFGFLVSALSIFAVFMTSAIIWNRLVARRRTMDAILASNPLGPQRLHRPTIWDIRVMPHKQLPPWLDVKPVAAQECERHSSSPRATQTEQTISFWRHHLLYRLPPEITYLFHRPIPPVPLAPRDTGIPQTEPSQGSDIQVSLLISMPHTPQSTQEGSRKQRLYEIVFATTDIPYRDPAPS